VLINQTISLKFLVYSDILLTALSSLVVISEFLMSKKRYAVVGTGGRAVMYIDGIADSFREHAETRGNE